MEETIEDEIGPIICKRHQRPNCRDFRCHITCCSGPQVVWRQHYRGHVIRPRLETIVWGSEPYKYLKKPRIITTRTGQAVIWHSDHYNNPTQLQIFWRKSETYDGVWHGYCPEIWGNIVVKSAFDQSMLVGKIANNDEICRERISKNYTTLKNMTNAFM
jgi:hypothetical protein